MKFDNQCLECREENETSQARFPFGADKFLLVPNCQHLTTYFYIVKVFQFSGKSYKGLAVT